MKKLTRGNAPRWEPQVQLVSITPDAEGVIERAYRNCWRSEPKDPSIQACAAFLEKCIRRGHLAPLEFAFATFSVVASRSCTHQMVRHRIASYAQESQRYVLQDNPARVVVPPLIYQDGEALEVFVEAMNNAWQAYNRLTGLGMRKEDSRYVLPNACQSVIFVGMNFRAWRHFLKLRCDKAAQWEIRGIAMKILEILAIRAGMVFADLHQVFIVNNGEGWLWTQSD